MAQQLRLTGDVTENKETGVARLALPAGIAGRYRIAQMDDYSTLPRGNFLCRPPVSLTLQARVSSNMLPGTWGFGFWNDPFALGMGIKGSGFRLPALPEAAWFFYGSPKNDLSFSSESPVNGLMASVFSSTRISPLLLPLGLPVLPFLGIRPAARLIRRLTARFIREAFTRLEVDATLWHTYRLDWLDGSVVFQVDDKIVASSNISPRPPLGMVIWIDNQYAAFTSGGIVRAGTQENEESAWLEIRDLAITTP
jgi:hypothetical protein